KMRFRRSAAWVVHSHVGPAFRVRSSRPEYHPFRVILQEERNVRKYFAKFGPKLVELEFVDMERIRSGAPARFGIVELIGRGNEKLPRRIESAPRLAQKSSPVFQVLDHFEADDQVDGFVGDRESAAVALLEPQIRRRIFGAGEGDRLSRT